MIGQPSVIFESSFKDQSTKVESLFSLKRVKRDIRALIFELSKMTPKVGLAVICVESKKLVVNAWFIPVSKLLRFGVAL